MFNNTIKMVIGTTVAMAFAANTYAADILDYVPSDTAFFLGNATPLPVEAVFTGIPGYRDFVGAVGGTQIDGEANQDKNDLFLALYNEYIALQSEPQDTLNRYGIGQPLDFAAYFSGVTPVLRFRLQDTDKFQSALRGFETANNLTATESELDGVYYRAYSVVSAKNDQDDAKLVVAIDGNMAVVTLDYNNASVLSRALSPAPSGQSIVATGRLADLNNRWGYSGEMTMIVDLQAMVEQYAAANGSVRQDLTQLMPLDALESLFAAADTPACVAELRSIASVVPAIVGGFRSVKQTDDALELVAHTAVDVEHPTLMNALQTLRGHIAPQLVTADTIFAFGFGFDVAALMPALSEISSITENLAYECEHFVDYPNSLRETLGGMMMGAGMFAGMAESFKGLSFGLYNNQASALPVNNSQDPFGIGALDMLFLMSSTNPQSLLQSTQMMPQTADIVIPESGSAVSLKEKFQELTGMALDFFAAQRGEHIAMFQGAQSTHVADNLAGTTANNNGLMYMKVDMKAFETVVMDKIKTLMSMSGQMTDDQSTQLDSYLASYPAGSSDFAVDITAEGLEFLTYTTIER